MDNISWLDQTSNVSNSLSLPDLNQSITSGFDNTNFSSSLNQAGVSDNLFGSSSASNLSLDSNGINQNSGFSASDISSYGQTAQSVIKPVTDIASTWLAFQNASQMEDYYNTSIDAMKQNITQSQETFDYNKGIKEDQNATYATQKADAASAQQ